MGAKLRETKRRIRTVQSMQRITRAMELIAASRILRAQERVRQARPYAEEITTVIQHVASQSEALSSPLLEPRPDPQAAGILVITSDRGLAGAYNANVLRVTEELRVRHRDAGIEPRLYVAGKKGVSYMRFRQRPVEESWTGFSEMPSYDNAKFAADAMIEAFEEHRIDELHLVYTAFASALVQRAEAVRVVPLEFEEVERPVVIPPLYEFEPDGEEILARLLPRYVEFRIFAAMLEAAASEQASRRRAMSAASDNADELVKVYTRQANRARQEEITQEIMEIVGGAEALKAAG